MFICKGCGIVVRDPNNKTGYCTDCAEKIRKEQEDRVHKCAYCGKEIKDRASNAKYCSKNCARNAEAHKRIEYISERSHKMQQNRKRERVLTAYGFKCAVCGWQATSHTIVNGNFYPSHGCEVHHITPVAEGGDESDNNLICLCPNCHKMVHMGLVSRDELRERLVDVKKANEDFTMRARCSCAEAITNAIFGGDE